MKQKGIVFFADILGYQNMIMRNSIDYTIEIIDKVLVNIEDNLIRRQSEENDPFIGIVADIKKSVIISDSIVVTFNTELETRSSNINYYTGILKYISDLYLEFFNNGLPIRGCIDYGEYYINGNYLAGQAILNSFNIASRLNLSGIAVTKDLYELYMTKSETFYTIQQFYKESIIPYIIPYNNNEEKEGMFFNWIKNNMKIDDPKQYVVNCFSKHNKLLDQKVQIKVSNTENTIRYFVAKKKEEI